jgi:DNA (cytosine-5)-methyltransferase 1
MPTPEQIRAVRKAHNLTQTKAATVIHSSLRTWQQWEAGARRMHPAFWELFVLKTSGTFDHLPVKSAAEDK